jgi:hypothetical protein
VSDPEVASSVPPAVPLSVPLSVPPLDRRRTRRRAGSDRARWLAARTANAARHALLIAGIGSLVMIGALLTFVLIPRRADRALATALAALPPTRDTVALRATSQVAVADRDRAAARLAALRAGMVPMATSDAGALIAPDSVTRLLEQQLARVRQAPLIDSYRRLATSPALSGEARARAAIDSMEVVHTEREAYAALSGPDARYAALTARLTVLGQWLEQVAADELARRQAGDRARASGAIDSTPLLRATLVVDTVLAARLARAESTLVRADSALADARTRNGNVQQRQDALRARAQITVPPVAMLLAALVLGLSAGFAVVLVRELRQPKVGDADELEALTHARVLEYLRAEPRRFSTVPRRSAASETGVPAVQRYDETWSLLHLLLTTTGDVSRRVQVLADRPLLGGAVALNLAAAAARESRATVLSDMASAGAVTPLIPTPALRRRAAARETASPWDATRALPFDRDVVIDLVLPRRLRPPSAARAATARPNDASLAALVADYDFAVFVTDTVSPDELPGDADVVLCARLGVTRLSWLAGAVRAIEREGRRVRAVLLWDGELPMAG